LFLALLASAALPAAARAEDLPPYKSTSLSFDIRAADLVKRLTLAEKAEQVQMAVAPNARLGIPPVNWWSEALHGVARAGTATIYPQALGLAATFNPPLIKSIADATAEEARAKFDPGGARYRGLMLWCPTVNMARDPRWGRTEETFGEDPHLAGRMGVAFCQGLQGDHPKYLKAVATPKHFAVHNQETGRMNRRFDVSEKLIRDYYFPAFQACFTEGRALSTMAAHTGINNIPCHANEWLLTQVLRNEWGFTGAVVSDWTGVTQLVTGQRYKPNDEEAIAAALTAGLDVMCDPRPMAPAVVRSVEQKLLKEEVLDRAVLRNITLRMKLGMFDPPEMVPYAQIPASKVGDKAHIALALQAAREATVLLQNNPAPRGYGFDKLLPLDVRKIDSIAVIGPYANLRQFGAYSAQSPAGPSPTILEAMRTALNAAGERVTINTADWTDPERVVQAAERSSVVIAVMGLNMQIEKEGIDRPNIDMPLDQKNVLEKIVRANPLTVLVLEGCGPIGLEWAKEHCPAILDIWYPGEQGANALMEVLFGTYNPAGRLPLTFYKTAADLPPLDDYDITKGRTYMYVTKPVSFPFGHGLSYTTFSYANLKAPASASDKDTLDLSLDLTNTGPLDGDEVVQLYVRKIDTSPHASPATSPAAAPARPLSQLKAFSRITLRKGETRPVRLALKVADLALWNPDKKAYTVDPGTYELLLGASSTDIRQRARIDIH
jgi:beta-glucosidase